MISISDLYEGIDQIMSFRRAKEELSSEKNVVRNTYIYCKIMVILLILTLYFLQKNKYILVLPEVKYCFLDIFVRFDRVGQALQEFEYQQVF
jgi:surface polysaccharide O-acyltransferase-like enzyme